jgi:hypothetical protein
MKHQRRFAPKGGRIESESMAGFVGISRFTKITTFFLAISHHTFVTILINRVIVTTPAIIFH